MKEPVIATKIPKAVLTQRQHTRNRIRVALYVAVVLVKEREGSFEDLVLELADTLSAILPKYNSAQCYMLAVRWVMHYL
jgi:hypothetical protein